MTISDIIYDLSSDIIKDISDVKLYEFDRNTTGFNFTFAKNLAEKEVIIVKMPPVSANKRGINDIGWLSDAEVETDDAGNKIPKLKLYGTLAKNPKDGASLVQEIRVNDDVNKTVSALIVVNKGKACRIEIRAIFF